MPDEPESVPSVATEAAPRGIEDVSIPITRPSFGPKELEAVHQPLETGWIVQGPFVQEFEKRFSVFTGAAHSVATTSCTTALHIAVAVLGLKPGDEVIVPAFTWVSTANVVEYQGATPVFCDIELETFGIDPPRIEELVTPRTVGIIPVHLFGLCADMDAINAIARRHGLWVVEDAACGFGGWYRGRHAGTLGDIGCFSFHPRKSITTGEGGMVTTAREEWAELARSLRDHGASRSDHARHRSTASFMLADYDHLGFNYRMTDLQGAVGCVQMERAEWILGERIRQAQRYDGLLAELGWLATPVVPESYRHGYQAYVCLFRPEEPSLANVDALHGRRNALMARMEQAGIATRPGTHAAAETGFYRTKYEIDPGRFTYAHLAERLSITLPLYPDMTDEQQDRVVAELGRAWEEI